MVLALPRRLRSLLVSFLLALCVMSGMEGNLARAQGYEPIAYEIELTRYQLQLGLMTFRVYQPPGFEEPFLEYDLNPIAWRNELGSHDNRLAVTPLLVTVDGVQNHFWLNLKCINCVWGERILYRYTAVGPVGEYRDFYLTVHVTGTPLGQPCTIGLECSGDAACVDGVCCNWDCGSNTQFIEGGGGSSYAGGPAGACMACSAARGAVRDGECTLLSADDRCEHGTCANDPVDGNMAPTASCGCNWGYYGEFCDANQPPHCATDNGGCDARTSCTMAEGARVCGACPGGYAGSGELGCFPTAPCALANGFCDPRTTCASYQAVTFTILTCGPCPSGFRGDAVVGCVDIDECATNNGGCGALTCTNQVGAPPTCTVCPSGYMGSTPATCVDIDECATNNGGCDPLVTCTNRIGAEPTCGACPSGTTGSGAAGCSDIDECATNNGGCDPLALCMNHLGASPTCSGCPSGYTGHGSTACVDIDECATNNGDCDALTTCTNEVGAPPTCGACPSGYLGTGETGCMPMTDAGMPMPDAGTEVDASVQEPDASVPEPDASVPEPDASVPAPDAGTTPTEPSDAGHDEPDASSPTSSGGCHLVPNAESGASSALVALGLALLLARRRSLTPSARARRARA